MNLEAIKNKPIEEQIHILKKEIDKTPNIGNLYRYLAHLYVLKNDLESAKNVFEVGIERNKDNLWLKLEYGDFYLFEVMDTKKAEEIYLTIFSHFKTEERSTMSPYRYILKRLTTIKYENGDFESAKFFYEKFYKIEPSDFYASDFLKYAEILLHFHEFDKAFEVIKTGIKTHPKNKSLKEFASKNFNLHFEESNIPQSDVLKIPVKTPLIKEDMDLVEVIKEYASKHLKENDILTISSCVAAISLGRIFPVDSIKLSPVAKFYSRFINQKSVPFGGAAPLANPYAMQIALEEVGFLRLTFGMFMGAVGKLFGIDGWFYKFAGEQTALIDDPPGAIPPYDYYIIPGPKDSHKFAEHIKRNVGHEVAIVDANELGRAWVVGHTEKVNKIELEHILSDNPAGNEDEKTPIVIVRFLK